MFFFTEKTIPFKGFRGDPTFPRGSNFFQGGSKTHITCDFQGVRTPYPLSGCAHDEVSIKQGTCLFRQTRF